MAHVEDCVKKGGKVLAGGRPLDALNATGGTFFEPTVIADVTRDMLPYQQETFGPLVPLIRFETEEEAIHMANDTE
jgi:succinate-semialdehyde dehydrogenase/glutarate-semialdehyde dehydrogenase